MMLENNHKTPIRFTKMHGIGNDFVVINAMNQNFQIQHLAISSLANRYMGIGFDQLLIIEPSKQADFFCRIFNSDGTEAEQCGNGLRCVARFLHEEKLIHQRILKLETKAGIYPLTIQDYDHIQVTMGEPQVKETLLQLSLSHNHSIPISVISVGNPHAIVKVASIDNVLANQLGAEIAANAIFPHGANVGFMEVINPHHIRLRTFERGAGETYACGSNACAAAVAGITNGWLQNNVNVEFRYGSILIEWNNSAIQMTGPASRVFSGEL